MRCLTKTLLSLAKQVRDRRVSPRDKQSFPATEEPALPAGTDGVIGGLFEQKVAIPAFQQLRRRAWAKDSRKSHAGKRCSM